MATTSFRALARTMDPVVTASRLLGSAVDADLESWYRTRERTDVDALYRIMRETCLDPVGLMQREDRGLSQLHRWTPGQRLAGQHRSFRRMATRHGSGSIHARLLAYNTWLIDPPLGIEKPPDRAARVREIGRALDAGGFDIMALCEVFKKRDGEDIEEEISFAVDRKRGPGPGGLEFSSGLQTMVRHPPFRISGSETRVYHTTGGTPDSLAQKGILHTEIDLGPGRIDLFLTHMYAKGADGDHDEFSPVRELQTAELGNFIQERRKPENVVMVVGDLNVDGRKNEYRRLLEMMYKPSRGQIPISPGPTITGVPTPVHAQISFDFELRLHDLWLTRGSRFGATAAPGEENRPAPQYERICLVDDEGYCNDLSTKGPTHTETDREPGYRLDYIFIEDPKDQHSFNLDVTRVRRRPFWRGAGFPKAAFSHIEAFTGPELPHVGDPLDLLPDGAGIDELLEREVPHYLSDHLGLEVTLIASPRDGP